MPDPVAGGAAAGTATAGAAGSTGNAGSAAPAAGATAASTAVLGGGAPADAGAAWNASLPADIAAKPWAKTHKSAETFWKSMDEAQSLIGRSIQIPGQNATAEDWARVWEKLGRPQRPDGYKLTAPKLPEGQKLPATLSEGFSAFAHSIGLSNWQAQRVVDHVGGKLAAEINPGPAKSVAETQKALKDAWGGAYERNLAVANRAIQYAGGEKLLAALRRTGAANDPDVAIAFARLGAYLAEDGVVSGEGPVGQASAKADLDKILNDKAHPYWVRNHPGHKDAMREVERLNQMLYGRP